jgi:hypothetical protein
VVLGACWGPNVMVGAAILTSASELANSPAEPRASRSRPEHGICWNEIGSLKYADKFLVVDLSDRILI